MNGVYVVATTRAYKVVYPDRLDEDAWHGIKLFPFPTGDTVMGYRALRSAVRWASTEFDIGNWSRPKKVYPKSYFPTPSLEMVQKEFPDFQYNKEFNTEKFRDPLAGRYEY